MRAAPRGRGLDGTTQGLLWPLALAMDLGGPALSGMEGWRVAPWHFAERHGLIVIVALGESIVALGLGASAIPLTAGPLLAATLGFVVVACLWWAYFDLVALVAERRLREREGAERKPAGARRVLLPPPPDDRRHRAARARDQEDVRARRRAAEDRDGRGAARRRRALPARPRRLSPAQHGDPEPPAGRRRRRAARARAARAAGDALVVLTATTVVIVTLIAYEAIRFSAAPEQIRHHGASTPPR